MATVKEFTRKGLPPQVHAYDDPSLNPIEFLTAVYRATHLPMSTRIQAASALLPYTEPRPARILSSHVDCKIIIGGLGPVAEALPGSTENHSQNLVSPNKTLTQVPDPLDPVKLREEIEAPFIPDYSTPPTPDELQEIKAAIAQLRPDLAHLPIPEPRFCRCGHWIFGPCPLGERCREKSKLN